jgi:hypothetical protein
MRPTRAPPILLVLLLAVLLLAAAGCGSSEPPGASTRHVSNSSPHRHGTGARSLGVSGSSSTSQASSGTRAIALDLSRTRPLGAGPRFRPRPLGLLVAAGAPVGRLRCGAPGTRSYGAHVELFADGHEIIIPAGIGISPPQRRIGARVRGGRCVYPLRTSEPTGVLTIDFGRLGGAAPTIGELFQLWGQPLGPHRLLAFTAPATHSVKGFLNGRPVRGDLRAIRLHPHSQIVLELGPHVDPHPSYRFPPGM